MGGATKTLMPCATKVDLTLAERLGRSIGQRELMARYLAKLGRSSPLAQALSIAIS